ncbi:MAG: ATP-dependent DNA helicase RecQ [bacterium]|nr:ATP-dependent DNA helicase RecQ [bacterium]
MVRSGDRHDLKLSEAGSGGDGQDTLDTLLRSTFGHTAFRPLQKDVCQSVAEGSDALLVMPTGAGKSLCYQLPGLARGGTTLVLSPLIALMEDQVQGLHSVGVAADRIHSGRNRETSRAVCRAYLAGKLGFLFVAPERLAVPGFPELLARRPPVLIAVDEAHCISHWGHDFRPEYRMLGERLPLLRPAPVIALTATATPTVQQDIIDQLDIPKAKRFIHGFRRTNLAVEVIEAKPSARGPLAAKILADPARRPAIIYTPSRKETEALAQTLNASFPSAAYHAGLPATARDRAQHAFLNDDIEVIVATIAFGMGVDKANVRTVIHTAAPGTLEGYYQEIGRAGRDGDPARAILLFSWADRRTHEYFLERDYPDISILDRVFRTLSDRPRASEKLRNALDMDEDVFTTALEKLWIHGGAIVDPEENASRGHTGWKKGYLTQRTHRESQIEHMVGFASGRGCRMLGLVGHFGDRHDSGKPCGTCDQCAPQDCVAKTFRQPNDDELRVLRAVLRFLSDRDGTSTGQLHTEVGKISRIGRTPFEALLDGLAESTLIDLSAESFEKDGRTIRYQRVWLTRQGRRAGDQELAMIRVHDEIVAPSPSPRIRKRSKRKATPTKSAPSKTTTQLDASDEILFDKLREWRLKAAKKRRVPAFHILSNKTLAALCRARPADEDELYEVPGVGPATVRKYGALILKMVRESAVAKD